MMKSILILFLSLILIAPLISQVRFLEPDTAVWRQRGIVTSGGPPGACLLVDFQYMLSRQDTFVGNHLYRKVFSDSKIFPNPTDGIINIPLADAQTKMVAIFNVLGSKVSPQTFSTDVDLIQIDISNHPDGIYFLLLKNKYNEYKYQKVNLLH